MRILMIYDGDYPWDVRVEKMTWSLVQHGHEVHLICRNLTKRPIYERFGRVHIHRVPSFSNDRLNYVLSFPIFPNPIWLRSILRILRREPPELIIVRDLPLALAAVVVGRLRRIPVIFDMAENYPAIVRDVWRLERFKAINLVIRNAFILDCVERICVKRVEGILAVVEESKARLMAQYALEDSRIDIVSNTPRLPATQRRERRESSAEGTVIKLIYIGGLQPVRNLEIVLRGIALNGDGVKCFLTIAGTGEGEGRLGRLVDQLELRGKVTFRGWVQHDSIGALLAEGDIGIVSHAATEYTNTTVPNKLFDYMAYELPVLASDTNPVRRIVESACCGLVYRHDSPADFARALRQLADPISRDAMGQRGRKAVESRYNWEVDSRVLIEAMHKAVAARSGAGGWPLRRAPASKPRGHAAI